MNGGGDALFEEAPQEASSSVMLPIARVTLDTPVPALDKLYDYSVPDDLDAEAQPGVRVKVVFGGRAMFGYIIERVASPEPGVKVQDIRKVVSPQPVLTPEVYRLARAVADRYVGVLSDVLRSAVVPRVARVDQEFLDVPELDAPTARSPQRGATITLNPTGNSRLRFDQLLVRALDAVGAKSAAIVVVPDARDLDVLKERGVELAAEQGLDPADIAVLSSDDGPTLRYREFLRVLHGQAKLILGTRSALFAPCRNVAFIGVFDDEDPSFTDPRAPYFHAREVALLRSQLDDTDLLFTGGSRSVQVQRLVDNGWLRELVPAREEIRAGTPQVVSTADDFEQERDPLARLSRLPHRAWLAIKNGLERGPVLVQVARRGYAPALACTRCRSAALCEKCGTSLVLRGEGLKPECPACGWVADPFDCPECGNDTVRLTTVGSARTAQELARSFPEARVLESAGTHIIDAVGDDPAIVIATPGAEPECEAGYAAVVLLDGDKSLSRTALDAQAQVVRNWFNAAIRARPQHDGGEAVVVSSHQHPASFLVRWAPVGAAERELEEAREVGMPPIRRVATVTGTQKSVTAFMDGLQLPESAQVFVTSAAEPHAGGGNHRAVILYSYGIAADVAHALRQRRIDLAPTARDAEDRVKIVLDGNEGL